jgi:hypothetical protein
VRGYVPPLLASSLSLCIGRRVLGLGDVTGRLRRTVAAHQPLAEQSVRSAGCAATAAPTGVPCLLLGREPQPQLNLLRGHGVQGKPHPVWSTREGRLGQITGSWNDLSPG